MRIRTALALLGAGLLLLALPAAGSATSVYGSISGSEWFSHAPTRQDAIALDVAPGQDTGGINGALESAGRALGHVQTTGRSPLQGVCVHSQNLDIGGIRDTTTDADGIYMLTGVRPGPTRIAVRGCTAGNYVTQYYSGAASQADATIISVSAWQSRYGIDATMVAAGHLSGHVQNGNGDPLAGFCVYGSANGNPIPSAVTDAGGKYTIGEVPPSGSYQLTAQDCWNHDYLSLERTGTLVAPPGTTIADFTLEPGATISGRVTDANGDGLPLACITATNQASGVATAREARFDGSYDIAGLTPGTYDVTFEACSAASFLVPVTDHDVVAPPAGTAYADAMLVAGGKLSGHIGTAAGPLEGVCVHAGSAGARSAADGSYTLGPLPAGTYTVTFTSKGCAAGDWDAASAAGVPVTAGQTTTGVDATLHAAPVPGAAPPTEPTEPGADPAAATPSSDPPAGPQSQPHPEPTARPGTRRCRVPRLAGKTLRKAKSLLKKSHCAPGRVARKRARRHKGTVVATNPRPGKVLRAGAKVALVVAR
jgi:hypothetical protein